MAADGRITIDTTLDPAGAEKGLAGLNSRLEKTSNMAKGIGTRMTGFLTAPFIAFSAAAVLASAETETAFAKLQAQLGLTGAEAENFGGLAKNLYLDGFGESIGAVSEALAQTKLNIQDLNGQALQDVTQQAITLADVFGMDIGETTRTAAVMAKTFGIEASAAMDMVAVGAQKGGDFTGELLDTMKEYSPQFSAMGYSATDMMDILITGANNGAFSLDKVGDAVKEFNIRAQDGSKGTAAGFSEIGLNADKMGADIAAGGEKGQAAFMATIAALAAMEDPVKRNQAGIALFGTQWEDLGSDVVLSLANSKGAMGEFDGAVTKMGDVMAATPTEQFKLAFRQAKEELAPLGDKILDFATNALPLVIAKLTELATWFDNLSPSMKTTIAVIGGILVALGPLLIAFGFMLPAIGALITVFTTISGAIAVVATGAAAATPAIGALAAVFSFLLGPFGLVILAIAAVIAISVLLYKNWDVVKAKAIEIWGSISAYFSALWVSILAVATSAWASISAFFTGIWTSIKTIFTTALNAIKAVIARVMGSEMVTEMMITINVWKALISAGWKFISDKTTEFVSAVKVIISAFWSVISNLFTVGLTIVKTLFFAGWNAMKTGLSPILNAMKSIVTTVWNAIKAFFTTVLNGIKSIFTVVFNAIKSVVTNSMNNLKTVITLIWNGVKLFFSSAWEAIKAMFVAAMMFLRGDVEGGMNRIKSTISSIFNSVKAYFSTVWAAIKQIFSGGIDNIKSTVKTGFDAALSILRGLIDDFKQIGKDLINGLIGGIGSMAKAVKDKVSSVVEGIKSAITGKKGLDTHSPSKVTHKYGVWAGLGLANGAESTKKHNEQVWLGMAKVITNVAKANSNEIAAISKAASIEQKEISKKAAEDIAAIRAKAQSGNASAAIKAAKQIEDIEATARSKKRKLTVTEIRKIDDLEKVARSNKRGLTVAELARIESIEDSSSKRIEASKKKHKAEITKIEEGASKERLDAIKSFIENKNSLEQLSLIEEANIWRKAITMFKEGTDEKITAQQKYRDALIKIESEIVAINEQYANKMQAINDRLKADEESLTKAFEDSKAAKIASYVSAVSLFDKMNVDIEKSGDELLENLKSQVDGFKLWQEQIAMLSGKAIDDGLMKELQAMGPKALPELLALNSMTADQLAQYSALYQEEAALARSQAESELIGMKADTAKRITELRATANAELALLEVEWVAKIMSITQATNDEFKTLTQIGKNAGQNLLDGLKSMEGALVAQAAAIARAVNAALQASLGGSVSLPKVPAAKVTLPKVPSLNVGTNFVSQDGLAMIHKGEEIVPAKYNGEYKDDDRRGKGTDKGGITQHITVNSNTPLSPYEVKKKQLEAARELALEWGV